MREQRKKSARTEQGRVENAEAVLLGGLLTDLRLGDASIDLEAEGDTVKIHRMPEDWQLLSSSA